MELIYEYKCKECMAITELDQKLTEDHPKEVKCSKCGGVSSRIYSASISIPDNMKAVK
jgi:putative FmdB family regulatory protein